MRYRIALYINGAKYKLSWDNYVNVQLPEKTLYLLFEYCDHTNFSIINRYNILPLVKKYKWFAYII